MSVFKTWNYGEKSEIVKKILDTNFLKLSKYFGNQVRALTSEEMYALPSEYKTNDLVVFNTTEKSWHIFYNGSWKRMSLIIEFAEFDWFDGELIISSAECYNPHASIQTFLHNDEGDELVCVDVVVKNDGNVVIKSDIPFNGKVVIA